ncbi:hypothetical protein C7N43_31765 [Sphingobacteriales bacterium UPWRP_1]|nr:hypothetical protein BVG80_09220 [Sphingobacteriales bacterium TSM_CSM]PSJ72914.1 hypothetical protein C7N43_31765 [Sphingobacteriales bacterium UPWRP_1]
MYRWLLLGLLFFLLLCVSLVFWIRYYFNRKVRKVFCKARKGISAHLQGNMCSSPFSYSF